MKKKPTYSYYVYKGGERVNVNDLSEEEQEYARKWVFHTLATALGYAPVKESDR